MDPASEELERRSRYLSSLIRRTKLGAAPVPAPAPLPVPEPEAAAAAEPNPEPEPAVGRRGEAKPALAAVEEKEKEKEKEKREVGGEGGGAKGKEIKAKVEGGLKEEEGGGRKLSVRVRAADMALPLQRRAIRLAYEAIAAMPRLDSKRLALALKKVRHRTSSDR